MRRRLYHLTQTSLPNIDVFSCVVNQIYYDRAPQAPVCGVPLYSIYPYPTAKQGCSIAVRLEDVHLAPLKTLGGLCRFLGLEWSDTLLSSTFAEKKWWNLPGLRRVSGFSSSIVSRKPNFGILDQWRLKMLAAPISAQFGYLPYGERPCAANEYLALLMSILLPFELEFRCFSLSRYRLIESKLWGEIDGLRPLKFVSLIALLPFLILCDYIDHRLTICRGFAFNRTPSTRFVELMKS